MSPAFRGRDFFRRCRRPVTGRCAAVPRLVEAAIMGWAVRVAPGVRVALTPRGVRTSVGPRGARIHFGAGRPTISTGSGPVTLWTGVGHSSRRPRPTPVGGRARASASFRQQVAAAAGRPVARERILRGLSAGASSVIPTGTGARRPATTIGGCGRGGAAPRPREAGARANLLVQAIRAARGA